MSPVSIFAGKKKARENLRLRLRNFGFLRKRGEGKGMGGKESLF
jgi:hypothetical protein